MIEFQGGSEPEIEGEYLCWVNPDFDVPYANKIMLMYMNGRWWHKGSDSSYRGVVYGYAGPIPSLKLIG